MSRNVEVKRALHEIRQGKTKKTVPLHILAKNMNQTMVKALPAYHALTGCDTTSHIASKSAFLTKPLDLDLISNFGIALMDTTIIENAERFLIACFTKRDANTFDEYRHEQYHDIGGLYFNKLACCSSTIHGHIKRAYLNQYMLWCTAANHPASFLTQQMTMDMKEPKMDSLYLKSYQEIADLKTYYLPVLVQNVPEALVHVENPVLNVPSFANVKQIVKIHTINVLYLEQKLLL